MGLATKQYTVTVSDTEELTRAAVALVGKGLTNLSKSRASASEESPKLSLTINGTPVRAYLEEVAFTSGGTTTARVSAIDVAASDRTDYDVTLTLNATGWSGTAKVIHLSLSD